MKFFLFSASALSVAVLVDTVSGHGYMLEPISRNYYSHLFGLDWGTEEGLPMKEYCPHCLNTKGVGSVCGTSEQGVNYDDWVDSLQQSISWNSNGNIYGEGDIITISTFLTAHHMGHMEVRACPQGRASTQECFDQNVLEFVEDTLYSMPKDESYPERGYYYGRENFNNNEFSMKFRLPQGLSGEEVLLQWLYVTANTCSPDGYAEYYQKFPQEWWNPHRSTCTPEQFPPAFFTGDAPERFVNCAEITVSSTEGNDADIDSNVVDNEEIPVVAPAPSPDVVSVLGTCGNGDVGNGICPDQTLCCSEWGWCGTAATGHCDGLNPVSSPLPVDSPDVVPITPSPPPEGYTGGDSRLIAYVGNWQACPTDAQIEQYTHIVIAFAVSYTWSPGKNVCSETCEIEDPPICENQAQPELLAKWKQAGKKIILSFGGAGMGGSWDGNNDCWEYCFGRETQVINTLTDIVKRMDLDGVDIDYEYFHEDNPSYNFYKGQQAQKFLKEVTTGLRQTLPYGSELTHAPMEPDVVPGRGYYEVLKEVANDLDFLMPQYYNGYIRPYDDFEPALDHFTMLTNDLFGGDSTKIVFGFCISDCPGFNLNGSQSASVISKVNQNYPCNGGAFFWVASHDVNAYWSTQVRQEVMNNECSAEVDDPILPDVEIEESCKDNTEKFIWKKKKAKVVKKDCEWFARKVKSLKDKKKRKLCKKKRKTLDGENITLNEFCQETCGLCTN